MLPDSITLPVDVLDDATLVDYVYTRYRPAGADASIFVNTATHDSGNRDEMKVGFKAGVRSGNYRGSDKTALKFTITTTPTGVDGTDIDALKLASVETSIPVGTTDADIVEMEQLVVAAVKHSFHTLLCSRGDL
jgi:hypothetical protein